MLVTEEIQNSIKQISLTESDICLLGINLAESLYFELLEEFVKGGDRRWWWESFSKESKSIQFEDGKGFEKIKDIVPDKNEKIWFIAEDDQLPFYPIYETTPEVVQRVIGECYGFEYYIVSKTREWLLCENHHGYLIGVGKIVTDRLAKYYA